MAIGNQWWINSLHCPKNQKQKMIFCWCWKIFLILNSKAWAPAITPKGITQEAVLFYLLFSTPVESSDVYAVKVDTARAFLMDERLSPEFVRNAAITLDVITTGYNYAKTIYNPEKTAGREERARLRRSAAKYCYDNGGTICYEAGKGAVIAPFYLAHNTIAATTKVTGHALNMVSDGVESICDLGNKDSPAAYVGYAWRNVANFARKQSKETRDACNGMVPDIIKGELDGFEIS